jgi:rRNA maturation endonuclease Nob1
MNITGLLIFLGILSVIVIIITKVLGTKKEERTQCQYCGKFYGGKPARCPHCGESLKWKRP